MSERPTASQDRTYSLNAFFPGNLTGVLSTISPRGTLPDAPACLKRRRRAGVSKRTVFFVSDQTGVTAETLGHSLLTQFDGAQYQSVSLPFVATVAHAAEVGDVHRGVVRAVQYARTLAAPTAAVRAVLRQANALCLDFFAAFLGPLEAELAMPSAHASGRAHGMSNLASYSARINATNFALANDDGAGARDYASADVVLVGVSRSGKTPTCLYLALQYGVLAANYPLTDEDLESDELPAALAPHRSKLDQLMERRDTIYDNLRDLRFEYRAGKYSGSDFELMKNAMETEAALVLTEIDQVTDAGVKRPRGPRPPSERGNRCSVSADGQSQRLRCSAWRRSGVREQFTAR